MDRIEYLMKNYSDVKLKLALVENQLINFRPISEESVIQSLVYEKPDMERVITSQINSRSETIALSFREKLAKENKEYWDSLMECYHFLKTELEFFESMVNLIPDDLKQFSKDLIFNGMSWDDISSHYEISRSTISYRKRKVHQQLKKCYGWMSRNIDLEESAFQIPLSN